MKPIIINMNEMSDSREVYESKPSKIIPIFLYICLAMFVIALLWMGFGRIDIVEKATGMIRPNQDVNTITNRCSGKIQELCISDGDTVEKDQLLYVIEHQEELVNQAYYQEQLEYYKEQVEQLNLYLQSIQENKNHFVSKDANLEYATKFENYQIQIEDLRKQIEFNKKDLKYQSEYLTEQIQYYEREQNSIEILINSVNQGKNLFDKRQNVFYYNQYEKYAMEYETLMQSYEDKNKEIAHSTETEGLMNSLQYYKKIKQGLQQFKKSVLAGKSNFSDETSTYYAQYEAYETKHQQYYQEYQQRKKEYEVNLELQGIAVSDWEVEESRIACETAKDNYNEYKDTALLDIQKQLDDVEQKIKEIELNQSSLISKEDLLKENETERKEALEKYRLDYIVSLQTNDKSIEENLKSLQNKIQEVKHNMESGEKTYVADLEEETDVVKYKNDELVSTLEQRNAYEKQVTELETNLEKVNQTIDLCYVKAPCSGVVHSIIDLVEGDTLSAQTEVMTILPKDDTQYKSIIYVSNSQIGKITEDMDVKVNIYAYPNSEYGYVTGKIIKVSNDIKVNSQTGQAYYQVEAELDTEGFYDKDGNKLDMKAGMSCEAKIITEDKSILKYVLEKLSLWFEKD